MKTLKPRARAKTFSTSAIKLIARARELLYKQARDLIKIKLLQVVQHVVSSPKRHEGKHTNLLFCRPPFGHQYEKYSLETIFCNRNGQRHCLQERPLVRVVSYSLGDYLWVKNDL